MSQYSWGGASAQQASPSPVDQYSPRARLTALLARAELDPENIGKAVREDPIGALQSVGFSQDQAQALTAAPAQAADDPVVALAAGCNDTSCVISLCPPTCFVTIPAIPGLCQPRDCGFFSLF